VLGTQAAAAAAAALAAMVASMAGVTRARKVARPGGGGGAPLAGVAGGGARAGASHWLPAVRRSTACTPASDSCMVSVATAVLVAAGTLARQVEGTWACKSKSLHGGREGGRISFKAQFDRRRAASGRQDQTRARPCLQL
jgi:hypothetical protein